jgi:hypothetical protein
VTAGLDSSFLLELESPVARVVGGDRLDDACP